jgi:hypothetical protein
LKQSLDQDKSFAPGLNENSFVIKSSTKEDNLGYLPVIVGCSRVALFLIRMQRDSKQWIAL